MNFSNTDCVKKEVKYYLHGFEQFHKHLIRKTDLDLWEWVLAQTYKIRNTILEEIKR